MIIKKSFIPLEIIPPPRRAGRGLPHGNNPRGDSNTPHGFLTGFIKYLTLAVVAASFAYGGFSISAPSAVKVLNEPAADSISADTEARLVALIERSLPSVVNVVGSKISQDGAKQTVSRGTGFIVSSDGLVLTNRHVVSQDNITYTVYLYDGSKYSAAVAGRDPLNDLAILQIAGKNLIPLPLGDSDKIKIGQTAIAIGNSLGRYGNTVTKGIISGLGRSIAASDNITGQTETLDNVIQTDAAINLGNSGGPLLNSSGEVLGINTAIEQSGRGVGFAIPINDAKRVLDSYKQYKRIVRPYLGVRYLTVTSDIQDEYKLKYDYGALINAGSLSSGPAVVSGSPAEKAGLKEGDVIIGVNGVLVRGDTTLLKLIQTFKPGSFITLMIWRGNTLIYRETTLAEMPVYKP